MLALVFLIILFLGFGLQFDGKSRISLLDSKIYMFFACIIFP